MYSSGKIRGLDPQPKSSSGQCGVVKQLRDSGSGSGYDCFFVSVGKTVNFSVSQFPHMSNEDRYCLPCFVTRMKFKCKKG